MTHVARVNPDKDDYETPPELFKPLNKVYNYTVDAAADEYNHLCNIWLPNAFSYGWNPYYDRSICVWCNPPFSKKEQFLERALDFRQKCSVISFLLPNNARETSWWNELVVPYADQVINCIRRANFYYKGKVVRGTPFPICIVNFYPRLEQAIYDIPKEIYWDWKSE